ncbi:MAG TPA: hypothetical protein VJ987_03310 [Anaerolineales bacterium]|nr:hypothetical protein [Anaerolineales bacterium]
MQKIINSEIRNRVAKIWLREDGIIQMVVDPRAKYTLADTRESLESIVKASKGKRRPLLADVRNIESADFATRQETAAFEEATSVGVLIDSRVSRLIGNVYINFSKPVIPTRLFTSEAEAVEWLKEFME